MTLEHAENLSVHTLGVNSRMLSFQGDGLELLVSFPFLTVVSQQARTLVSRVFRERSAIGRNSRGVQRLFTKMKFINAVVAIAAVACGVLAEKPHKRKGHKAIKLHLAKRTKVEAATAQEPAAVRLGLLFLAFACRFPTSCSRHLRNVIHALNRARLPSRRPRAPKPRPRSLRSSTR